MACRMRPSLRSVAFDGFGIDGYGVLFADLIDMYVQSLLVIHAPDLPDRQKDA